jgi:hypothetical protein
VLSTLFPFVSLDSLCGLREGHLWLVDQLLEKSPVINHCLAQFFRAGTPSRLPKRDFVSRSVVFQNQWMIHGNICCPLFKVAYRIAPRGHHLTQQLVCFRYRTGWAVNEARLDSPPGLYEARTIACSERPDVKRLDSLPALFEPGFRMPSITALLHGAIIFSATELSAQTL